LEPFHDFKRPEVSSIIPALKRSSALRSPPLHCGGPVVVDEPLQFRTRLANIMTVVVIIKKLRWSCDEQNIFDHN
jgi:hypothetical protein